MLVIAFIFPEPLHSTHDCLQGLCPFIPKVLPVILYQISGYIWHVSDTRQNVYNLLYPSGLSIDSWFVWSCRGLKGSSDSSCICSFHKKVSNLFTKEVIILVYCLDLETKERDSHRLRILGTPRSLLDPLSPVLLHRSYVT